MICDVSIETDVEKAVNQTIKTFGRIDVALACAAIATMSATLSKKKSMDMKIMRQLMEINFYGSMHVAKFASVAMTKNKPSEKGERGLILFVSSIASEQAMRGQGPYGATKGAIRAMTLPMARDMGQFGIRVVSIQPGLFTTPMSSVLPPAIEKLTNKLTPQGRFG